MLYVSLAQQLRTLSTSNPHISTHYQQGPCQDSKILPRQVSCHNTNGVCQSHLDDDEEILSLVSLSHHVLPVHECAGLQGIGNSQSLPFVQTLCTQPEIQGLCVKLVALVRQRNVNRNQCSVQFQARAIILDAHCSANVTKHIGRQMMMIGSLWLGSFVSSDGQALGER